MAPYLQFLLHLVILVGFLSHIFSVSSVFAFQAPAKTASLAVARSHPSKITITSPFIINPPQHEFLVNRLLATAPDGNKDGPRRRKRKFQPRRLLSSSSSSLLSLFRRAGSVGLLYGSRFRTMSKKARATVVTLFIAVLLMIRVVGDAISPATINHHKQQIPFEVPYSTFLDTVEMSGNKVRFVILYQSGLFD